MKKTQTCVIVYLFCVLCRTDVWITERLKPVHQEMSGEVPGMEGEYLRQDE